MNDFLYSIQSSLGPTLWNIIVFVLILLVGYVVAKVVEAVTRKGLRRTTLDNRIASALSDRPETEIPTERYISKGLFWLVMVFVFIAAFDALNLAAVSEPLSRLVTEILAFLPRLLGAAILALIAFVVASLLRMLTTKALHAANVDERIREAGDDAPRHEPLPAAADRPDTPVAPRPGASPERAEDRTSLAETLGNAVYYFILLLFLPAILGTLGLEGILAPIRDLVNEIVGFLPNLLLAAIIVVIGAFVAKILRNIVANLLAAAGVNRLGERLGLARATGGRQLSDLIGLVVYVLVLIPVIVAALNALDVEAVTRPASAMLNEFLAAIPRVFVAALILAVAYVVGRLLASLVANVLEGVGFNRLFEALGFSRAHAAPTGTADVRPAAEESRLDTRTPAGIAGIVVLVGIMLFAAAEAASALDLEVLAVLIAEFTVLAGRVLLGLVIFGVGLYLANLAYSAVKSSGTSQATVLAVASRVAILVLAGAMALKQMGLADSIINLAFGLILGAIAVAAAIAFGIGGRDLAREQLEKLRDHAEQDRAPDALKPDPREPGTETSRRDPRPGSV